MLPLNIKNSLNVICEELKDIESRREYLIKESRELVILCSKTIIEVHQDNLETSQSKLDKAKAVYLSLKDFAKDDLSRYLYASEQEFVEANIVLAIAKDKFFPSLDDMNVTGQSYLLGLLDSIGEIKRMIYDKVRSGNYEDADFLFIQMQEIYNAVYPFAVYDNFVSGIRKKLDISRILIENTRELMTEESRRSILIQSLNKFNNTS